MTPPTEPYDLRCDADSIASCSGDCPQLPEWPADADGFGSFDRLLGLGAADRDTVTVCRSKLRACQACIERGRKAGVIR